MEVGSARSGPPPQGPQSLSPILGGAQGKHPGELHREPGGASAPREPENRVRGPGGPRGDRGEIHRYNGQVPGAASLIGSPLRVDDEYVAGYNTRQWISSCAFSLGF